MKWYMLMLICMFAFLAVVSVAGNDGECQKACAPRVMKARGVLRGCECAEERAVSIDGGASGDGGTR